MKRCVQCEGAFALRPGRAGPGRAGPGRAGPGRAGPGRAGPGQAHDLDDDRIGAARNELKD